MKLSKVYMIEKIKYSDQDGTLGKLNNSLQMHAMFN